MYCTRLVRERGSGAGHPDQAEGRDGDQQHHQDGRMNIDAIASDAWYENIALELLDDQEKQGDGDAGLNGTTRKPMRKENVLTTLRTVLVMKAAVVLM